MESQISFAASKVREKVFEPRVFGRYYLIDQISKGGMSNIYLAKATSVAGFQKPLVIKKLLPQYASKTSYVKRFVNEANTLTRLNHSNIVQILDMGIIDGEYYIATEYIEGRNVAHILSKAGRHGNWPSLEFTFHLVMDLSHGLAYAHRKKGASGEHLMLVHRDVNSFNVMMSYEAEVKLIDFGIARIMADTEASEGLPVAGKLLYFSPEQLLKNPVDRRCDIYGIGVLLYEILTGQRLVQHQETVQDTIRMILEMDIASKVGTNERIPQDLKPVLAKAMAMDPGDRYGWIEEMIEDLRGVMGQCSLQLRKEDFAAYLKELFRSEILLDRRRMRKLRAEEPSRKALPGPLTGQSKTFYPHEETDTHDLGMGVEAWPFADTGECLDQQLNLDTRVIAFARDKRVFHQGDPGNDVYLVHKGKVRLYLQSGQHRQTLHILEEGDFFPISSLLDHHEYTVSAKAEEECTLIAMSPSDFHRLLRPDFFLKIVHSMAKRLEDVQCLLEGTTFEDTLSRLIYALIFCVRRGEEHDGFDVDMGELRQLFRLEDSDQLRKYLGKLASLNVIEGNEQTVHINNPESLENILSVLVGRGKLMLKL